MTGGAWHCCGGRKDFFLASGFFLFYTSATLQDHHPKVRARLNFSGTVRLAGSLHSRRMGVPDVLLDRKMPQVTLKRFNINAISKRFPHKKVCEID